MDPAIVVLRDGSQILEWIKSNGATEIESLLLKGQAWFLDKSDSIAGMTNNKHFHLLRRPKWPLEIKVRKLKKRKAWPRCEC